MTTRIFLIRHGATELSAEDRFAGSSDVELSVEGRAQIEKLGIRLAKEPIAAVYSSDMHRAVHTAEAVAKHHGLSVTQSPALREINHGHWEGLVHKDVETRFAAEYAAWDADPLLAAPSGGETGLAVLNRSLPELRRIVLDHAGQMVAVVSHKATNRLLLASVLGLDLRTYRDRLAQDLACLNVLEFKNVAWGKVVSLNDVSHYR